MSLPPLGGALINGFLCFLDCIAGLGHRHKGFDLREGQLLSRQHRFREPSHLLGFCRDQLAGLVVGTVQPVRHVRCEVRPPGQQGPELFRR